MSPDFVRYTPELETIDPQIDDLLAEIVEFWRTKGRQSPTVEGSGRAVRGAHAKSYGLVKAELRILHVIPPAYAQGMYAKPHRHGVLMRFSSSSGHLGTDVELGPGLGCALKIFGVDGPKLMEEEPDVTTSDLVLKNNPMFIANTARHYLYTQDVVNDAPTYLARGKEGFHAPLSDFLTGNISGPENAERSDALAFNQWRVTAEHRPLGEVMNVHRIYTASAKVRRELNHQPQTEPSSADEVLPVPGGPS